MITLFSLSNSDLFTSAKNSGFYSRVKHFCVGKSQIYVSIFVGKSRMPTQIRMAVYYCVVSCGPLHTTMGIHPASMTSSTFSKKESLCRFMWIFFLCLCQIDYEGKWKVLQLPIDEPVKPITTFNNGGSRYRIKVALYSGES